MPDDGSVTITHRQVDPFGGTDTLSWHDMIVGLTEGNANPNILVYAPSLVQYRQVDTPADREAVLAIGDADAVERQAPLIVEGAVDGIDDPASSRSAGLLRELLTQDTVVREGLLNPCTHLALGLAVMGARAVRGR